MRTLLLASLPLLLAACAGAPPARERGAPGRVVVVAASHVARPVARSLGGAMVGEEEPRDVVAREAAEALRQRGYQVLAVSTAFGEGPAEGEPEALARRMGAEAAVVLVLTRLELSALQPLGQAELEVRTRLVGAEGRVLWSGAYKGATSVKLYRARTDWRAHVRQGVIQAIRELP